MNKVELESKLNIKVQNYCHNGMSFEHNSEFYLGLQRVIDEGVEGDFFDIGSWSGTISFLTAIYFKHFNIDKKIYLFDTFDGHIVSQKQEIDSKWTFPLSQFKAVSIQRIENTFKSLDFSNYEIVKGDIMETLPGFLNHKICFASTDLNFYAPTVFALNFLAENKFKGIIFEDDYNHIQGITEAFNEREDLKLINLQKTRHNSEGGFFKFEN